MLAVLAKGNSPCRCSPLKSQSDHFPFCGAAGMGLGDCLSRSNIWLGGIWKGRPRARRAVRAVIVSRFPGGRGCQSGLRPPEMALYLRLQEYPPSSQTL